MSEVIPILSKTLQTSRQTGSASIFLPIIILLWFIEERKEQPALLANAHDSPAIP